MDIYQILHYLSEYGLIFLFLIVFLEYLNLPGLPAGIIMPATGILISRTDQKFIVALIISVIAGVLGSLVLYLIGYYGGNPLLEKFYNKYPKIQPYLDKLIIWNDKYGDKSNFFGRLIPVARTIISLTSGTFRCNVLKFIFYSTPGITIWNFIFIFSGYAFGDIFLK